MGCEVYRSMYLSDWVNHSTWPKFFTRRSGQDIINKSKPYIEIGIGGHERMNIGSIINYKEAGFDGVIHLMPFACLPELVTQSMAPRISKDWQMPILTLALDEQTGIANNLTRIEAFVELLRSIKINRTANGGTSDE
jgi:predicted nucleotide-binding protein (sugar kinase/HSP70/actin superfamily)